MTNDEHDDRNEYPGGGEVFRDPAHKEYSVWRVRWDGRVCAPTWLSKGAAEAYRAMLRSGARQPEYPADERPQEENARRVHAQIRRDQISAEAAVKRLRVLLRSVGPELSNVDVYDVFAHASAIVTRQLVTLARREKQAAVLGREYARQLEPALRDLEAVVLDAAREFTARI